MPDWFTVVCIILAPIVVTRLFETKEIDGLWHTIIVNYVASLILIMSSLGLIFIVTRWMQYLLEIV